MRLPAVPVPPAPQPLRSDIKRSVFRYLCVLMVISHAVFWPTRDAHAANAQTAVAASSFYRNFLSLALINQHKQPFKVADLQGKVVLFNFIYTQCSSVCSAQTKALVQLQKALPEAVKKQFRLVSISLDPLHDTPAQLKAFAARAQANGQGWQFLTGKPSAIAQLSDQLYLFDHPNQKTVLRPNDHATALWLVDRQGRLLMRYSGTPPDNARLLREISQLTQAHTL